MSTPKYNIGDMVYSYQNESYPAAIEQHRKDTNQYKLRLTQPYSRRSNWIQEHSLSLIPLNKETKKQ